MISQSNGKILTPCKALMALKTQHKSDEKTQTERITTKVSFRLQSNDTTKTMRVFVMLKFLRDEIAAVLHSCLPDPYFVLRIKYEKIRHIDLLLANQIAHIFRTNDNNILRPTSS